MRRTWEYAPPWCGMSCSGRVRWGGIYTSLLFSPNDWVFVRATDMPFLHPKLPCLLIEAMADFDAGGCPCAANTTSPSWPSTTAGCLQAVAEVLERSEKQIIKFFKYVRVRSVPEKEWRTVDPEGISFKNVNYPDDLEKL